MKFTCGTYLSMEQGESHIWFLGKRIYIYDVQKMANFVTLPSSLPAKINDRIHNHVTNFKTLPLPPFCVDVINVKSLFYTTPKKNCLWIMFSQKSSVITTRQIWKWIKISGILNAVSDLAHAQPPFACSKLTIETLENEVNYVQRTSKC